MYSDRESSTCYADLATSEDFLGSHAIHLPVDAAGELQTFIDGRNKAKQFNTLNGRTLVIKDGIVYSNKGFRNLSQAHLLSDALFYADSPETQSWLIYYISRPLVGLYEPVQGRPSISTPIKTTTARQRARQQEKDTADLRAAGRPIQSFDALLDRFPIIARQIRPGLENVLATFAQDLNDWVPHSHSRTSSNTSQKSLRSLTSEDGEILEPKKHPQRRRNAALPRFSGPSGSDAEAGHMRITLESAVTNAIELFRQIDNQQLSLVGSTTNLTGPMVETLIEKYVASSLHEAFLFPRLCNSVKKEDVDLESRVRGMRGLDLAQAGVSIENGRAEKNAYIKRINEATTIFRRINAALCPHEMLAILLDTQKVLSGDRSVVVSDRKQSIVDTLEEKTQSLAVNADALVSLLLIVIVRSNVCHLHARLSYMQDFIFLEDVEAGEAGYALSTLEAVLLYLATDSAGLRRASRRNTILVSAVREENVAEMKNIFSPSSSSVSTDTQSESETDIVASSKSMEQDNSGQNVDEDTSNLGKILVLPPRLSSQNLAAIQGHNEVKRKKVTMDVRSSSNASIGSFISRSNTMESNTSVIEGDTSVEVLSQIQDYNGNSVLMLAVEGGHLASLEYLFSLRELFPVTVIREDVNQQGTTLLAAAVRLGNTEVIKLVLKQILDGSSQKEVKDYFAREDDKGRTMAHYLFNAHLFLPQLSDLISWTKKDMSGQTPLFALCRSYDHPEYNSMVEIALKLAVQQQDQADQLYLDEHTDSKDNTLLHIIHNPSLASYLLACGDCDTNAPNDRRLTPLMVASKYGRLEMVKVFFADPRVDISIREHRGLTAIELAKDDEIRNRIDDLVLVSNHPAADGRVTAVVRPLLVEDGTVRLVIKSAIRNDNDCTITITTCKRSTADFENLGRWLALEHPASWLPAIFNFRSPFAIMSRPAKSVANDIQVRLHRFLQIMLSHSTFGNHELLWEFILFPEIQPSMMAERSRKTADTRNEKVSEDYEPLYDFRDVSIFVEHARESLRGVNHSTKRVIWRLQNCRLAMSNMAQSLDLAVKDLALIAFLPESHQTAFRRYVTAMQVFATDPYQTFYADMTMIYETILAILSALARPHALIRRIGQMQKVVEKHESAVRRSDRWPFGGLLDETRKGMQVEAQGRVEGAKLACRNVACELRYTQQTVASELASWQELHVELGRRAIRDLATQTLVRERDRLASMRRALRLIKRE